MKVCNFSLGKFFIFLCFSFISIFNLSASCVKVEDTSFVFLSQDGEECINKSESGVLPIPNGGVNNFDVLIPGKNDGGYTVELVFDRDNQVELSGEQSLFAFYSSEDAINPVSELVLKGSSIFYKVNNTNTEDQEGVDLSGSAFNDANITNPHAIIIVHDNVDNQVIFNIDGAELKIPDVPSVNATDIKRVKIGKNYVGNISEFRVYGTELALKERAGAVKLLSGITGAKIAAIELVKDENGVTRSAVDSSDLVKCKTGQTVINGKCNNAMISGFEAPSNSIYNGGTDIQYDPAHNGQENAKLLDCNIGYEVGVGATPPKYWFTLDGYVPSVRTEGSCSVRDYSSDFIAHFGANDLSDLNDNFFINPASVTYNQNDNQLPCIAGFNSPFGNYNFDSETGDIIISGQCQLDTTQLSVTNGLVLHLDASVAANNWEIRTVSGKGTGGYWTDSVNNIEFWHHGSLYNLHNNPDYVRLDDGLEFARLSCCHTTAWSISANNVPSWKNIFIVAKMESAGGNGAIIRADFSLNKDNYLKIGSRSADVDNGYPSIVSGWDSPDGVYYNKSFNKSTYGGDGIGWQGQKNIFEYGWETDGWVDTTAGNNRGIFFGLNGDISQDNELIYTGNTSWRIAADRNWHNIGYGFRGSIHEILAFNRKLTKSERERVNYYLSQKWGITATVDSDDDGLMDSVDDNPIDNN